MNTIISGHALMQSTLRRTPGVCKPILIAGLAGLTFWSMSSCGHAADTIEFSSIQEQTFDGFGAAQAFDCSALSLQAPDEATQAAYYDALFSDLNLSILRLDLKPSFSPISGRFDYATAVKASGQEAVINAARARNPKIRVMYTVWSPPAYMKTNNSLIGGHLATSSYDRFGAYLAEFTRQFYVNEGYPVDLVSLQNEPDLTVGYDCCVYSPQEYAAVLAHTSPRIRAVALANGYTTKIIGAEWSGANKDTDPWYGTVVNVGTASHAVANPNLDIGAIHSYWGNVGAVSALSRSLRPVYETEFSNIRKGETIDSPQQGARTTEQFCQDFNYGQVSAWMWWWLSWTFHNGEGQALTLRAQRPDELTTWTAYKLTKKYYAFKAMTHIFLPGSVGRPATISAGPAGGLQAAGAMGPHGLFEIAVSNDSGTDHAGVRLKIDELAGAGSVNFTRIVVDTSHDYAVSKARFVNGVLTDDLPAYTSCFYVQQDRAHRSAATRTGASSLLGRVPPAPRSHGSAPMRPGRLVATAGQWSIAANTAPGQVSLAWPPCEGAKSYTVYRSLSPGREALYMPGLHAAHYTDVGLQNGVSYYYRVAAVNAFGSSPLSSEAVGKPMARVSTPRGGTAPAIPGNVYFSNYDRGGEYVAFHDADDANRGGAYRPAEGVDIARGGDPEGNGYAVGWCSPGEWLKFTVNARAAGPYTVSFRVANGAASPGKFHMEDESHHSITGDVAVPPTGGTAAYATVNATAVLRAGVQVLKFCEHTGGYSLSHMTFVDAATPPAAPIRLKSKPGNRQVSLTWVPARGATSYNLFRSASAGGGSAIVAAGLTSTSYIDKGLRNGVDYYFAVAATSASGVSARSSKVRATPVDGVPEPPTGLTATPGNAQAALSWSASSGAASYSVLRSTASGS